jgi:hypothetical protein
VQPGEGRSAGEGGEGADGGAGGHAAQELHLHQGMPQEGYRLAQEFNRLR